MRRNYYIFTPGRLKRKENTIFFEPFNSDNLNNSDEFQDDSLLLSCDAMNLETDSSAKTVIPVNDIEAFYIMAETTLNTKFLDFLAKSEIPAHFFNYYGFYNGSYYPREHLNSGFLIVNQVQHYLDKEKRMIIARKFVEGAVFNILMNLKYYNRRERDILTQIHTIESIEPEIAGANDIPTLMNIEGRIRKVYYSAFEAISPLDSKLCFRGRTNKRSNGGINFKSKKAHKKG